MDHSEAIEGRLVERYMLEELSEENAERFEAHFFQCDPCASDVRSAVALMRYGREVAAEPVPDTAPAPANVVPISTGRRISYWLGSVAAALVAFVLGGPLLRTPAPSLAGVASLELPLSQSRGAAEPIETVAVAQGDDVHLWVPVEAAEGATAYVLSVRPAGEESVIGKRRYLPNQINEPVELSLRDIEPGTYEVVTTRIGGDGRRTVAATKTFRVTR